MSINFKTILINTSISLIIGMLVYLVCHYDQKKIVVVDAIRLFNGFKMKVEMEERDARKLKMMNNKADSLENILKIMQKNNPNAELNKQSVYEYQLAKSNAQREYEISNNEINEQVWKRLNLLIADFGKEMKIRIIVGANGMGSVLYNDAKDDMTEQAIQYINNRYENKK